MPSIETLEGPGEASAVKPDAQGDSGDRSVAPVAPLKELEDEEDDTAVESTQDAGHAEDMYIHADDTSGFVVNFGAGKVGQILAKGVDQNNTPQCFLGIDDNIVVAAGVYSERHIYKLDEIDGNEDDEVHEDVSMVEDVNEPDMMPSDVYYRKNGDGDNKYKHCDPEHDDDFDETLGERLWGLTEMFPESLRNASSSLVGFSVESTKTLYSVARVVLWVAASSATILAMPVMFETERSQMEEQQMQQQRQILLGPNAATAGSGGPAMGSMPMGVPAPPR